MNEHLKNWLQSDNQQDIELPGRRRAEFFACCDGVKLRLMGLANFSDERKRMTTFFTINNEEDVKLAIDDWMKKAGADGNTN